MLSNDIAAKGFCFISPEFYVNQQNASSIYDLKKVFTEKLAEDGLPFRKRAYLKLQWNTITKKIEKHPNQHYFQDIKFNQVDGGKIRQFKILSDEILSLPIVKNILEKNITLIAEMPEFSQKQTLTIGLHFIRYHATEDLASYSSPAWLHKDDEPLVFIHLVNLSKSALGGDNLIADNETKNVTHVIRLEEDIDTLVLNQNVYHAVTPLGSKKGIATRDVILFTIEKDILEEKNHV